MRMLARTGRTRLGLVGATVLAVVAAVGGLASAAQSAAPSAASLKSWHSKIVATPHPSAKGCFTATYPRLTWRTSACTSAPAIPMTPKHQVRPLLVGNGNDISAQAPSGTISQAWGSFENLVNVTSESSPVGGVGAPVANAYSLQLNTNFFASTACALSPNPACQGWEQFVYANNGFGGQAFIQYWLLSYNTACPGGWNSFSFTGDPDIYCYRNSPTAVAVPNQPISNLGNLQLSGTATAGADSVTMLVGLTAYATAGSNAVNAAAGWSKAEFGIFGDGGGGQANFNAGASLNVRTRINYGGTAAPLCAAQGFTGETNNLSFGKPTPAPTSPGPARIFVENMIGGAVACSSARAVGDTHETTVAGSAYDFQSSGDFVEAQVGSDFEVQTRKDSGAPSWPNASVNKSVATRMGSTKVALCEGKTLVVDGRATQLPSGGSMHLASGVDVWHTGNVYTVTDGAGNQLRVTVNSTYLDVQVGTGTWPTKVVGLLGNPDNDPWRLEARDGTQFKLPISFTDL